MILGSTSVRNYRWKLWYEFNFNLCKIRTDKLKDNKKYITILKGKRS